MKRKQINTALNNELYNVFKDMYVDEAEINQNIKDAKKAFSFVQQDVLYRKDNDEE